MPALISELYLLYGLAHKSADGPGRDPDPGLLGLFPWIPGGAQHDGGAGHLSVTGSAVPGLRSGQGCSIQQARIVVESW